MMRKVKIQPAQPEQIPLLAALARQSFPDPWSEQLFAEALASPYTKIWTAMDGTQLTGYLVLQQLGAEQSVDDLAVSPTWRGQQIATQLLEAAHQTFPNCDFILEVRESNQAARNLYQKLGYLQDGYRKRYYQNPPEAAILMRKAARSQSN